MGNMESPYSEPIPSCASSETSMNDSIDGDFLKKEELCDDPLEDPQFQDAMSNTLSSERESPPQSSAKKSLQPTSKEPTVTVKEEPEESIVKEESIDEQLAEPTTQHQKTQRLVDSSQSQAGSLSPSGSRTGSSDTTCSSSPNLNNPNQPTSNGPTIVKEEPIGEQPEEPTSQYQKTQRLIDSSQLEAGTSSLNCPDSTYTAPPVKNRRCSAAYVDNFTQALSNEGACTPKLEPIDAEPEGPPEEPDQTQPLGDVSESPDEPCHRSLPDNNVATPTSRRGHARTSRVNESMEVPKSLSTNEASLYRQFIVIGGETLPEPADIASALVSNGKYNLTYWVDGVGTLKYSFIGINLRNRIFAEEVNGNHYKYDDTDVGDLCTVIAHEIDRYMSDKPLHRELIEFINAFLDGFPGGSHLDREKLQEIVHSRIKQFQTVFLWEQGGRKSYSFVSRRSTRKRRQNPQAQ